MSTIAERRKALRGTKRACQACEVRFYDLGLETILCPSCGAQYIPAAQPVVAARAAPFSGKTGWRSRPFKRPEAPITDTAVPALITEAADADSEAVSEAPEDDTVLDQQDDAESSGLVEVDLPEENP
jgi:uncharacterized protein (TIGR02300 family)